MKHVFFVHSQITKLISFSIIQDLCLNQQDIAIITYRGTEFYHGYQSYSFPFTHYPVESFPLQKNFFSSRLKLKKLDNFIKKITNNEYYILYLPQVNERMLELMTSHYKCVKYNLIEEGKLSFSELDRRYQKTYSSKEYLLLKLNYGNRLSRIRRYLPDTYANAFKFSDAAFPDYERVSKISLHTNHIDLEYRNILVLEPLVEAQIIYIDDYLIALQKIIKFLSDRKIKTIFYKFHPDQQQTKSKKNILKLFKETEQISLIEIKANIALEEIAVSSQVTFYSVFSSILYYGKILGSNSYSFMELIPSNANIKNYFEMQPKAFKENIYYIQELVLPTL